MPQLDSNTFLTQYCSLVVLLLFVYIALGYIILPILMRLMLIRSFSLSLAGLSKNLNGADYISAIALFNKKPIYLTSLLNNIYKDFSFKQMQLQYSALNTIKSPNHNFGNTILLSENSSISTPLTPIGECFTSYLIIFLTIDDLPNE